MKSAIVAWKGKPLRATVQLPFSKSISNRLLIMEALCGKKFQLKNISEADDTKLLQQLLASNSEIMNAGNAGTCYRFLTAYFALQEKEIVLTGTDRMKQRPVGELVDALRKSGAEIKYLEQEHFPPLLIQGRKLHQADIEIDSPQSSQFVSALLLIAPYIEGGLKLKLKGEQTSTPYIGMTLKLMGQFGIKYLQNENEIEILKQEYISKAYSVEPDWSAAAFWFAMAALSDDAEIFLEGLSEESIQGDSIVSELMKKFGVQTKFYGEGMGILHMPKSIPENFSFNFSQHPDLAPVFFVLCSALGVDAKISGVKNLSFKESKRTEALKKELEKCGAEILKVSEDEYRVSPRPFTPFTEGERGRIFAFNTYDDHRLAMAFAMLAIPLGKVEIKNPAVVSKSYPDFWTDLRAAGFEVKFS
jgi:3-phosphoshikimate 1-carboxyvinyltransferase